MKWTGQVSAGRVEGVDFDAHVVRQALESAGAGDGADEASRVAMGIGQAIYEAWADQ